MFAIPLTFVMSFENLPTVDNFFNNTCSFREKKEFNLQNKREKYSLHAKSYGIILCFIFIFYYFFYLSFHSYIGGRAHAGGGNAGNQDRCCGSSWTQTKKTLFLTRSGSGQFLRTEVGDAGNQQGLGGSS
jgi:hypothetical protein